MVTAVGGRLECPINEEFFIGMRAPERHSLSPTLPKKEGEVLSLAALHSIGRYSREKGFEILV